MSKVRHVDFYPDEWLSGTATLTAVEIGVYISACALIYSHGGPIEKTELRRFVECHGKAYENAVARLLALGKLIAKGSYLTNKRCENEMKRTRNRAVNAMKNGSKGGRPTKKNNGLAKPGGFRDKKLTTNYQLPTTNHQPIDPPKSPPNGGKSAQAEFDDWWEAYPRKVGKAAAARKYLVARKAVDARTLLAAAKHFAELTSATEKQFIVHPAAWLHQGRWTDEDLQPAAQTSPDRPNGPPPKPEDIWPDLKDTRH